MIIHSCEKIYLDEYDINVNPRLTYAQIQNIANEAIKYQSWSERNTIIDYMVLCYATDAVREEIDEIGLEAILLSGLLDTVKSCVENYCLIYEAIDHEESITKQIAMVMEALPKIAKEAVEKVNTNELH